MDQVVTVGLDIAKSVFQVHGVDAAGEVIVRRQIRRAQLLPFFAKLPGCVIGIEACASAHYWARELGRLGHRVRLMPASYVKPYVKRQKNDAADAEAICEAVTRPTMRFVDVKSPAQQSVMVLHRVRLMLIRQRTQLSNAIRGHMAEFGVVAPIGREGLQGLIRLIVEAGDERVPDEARTCLELLSSQLDLVNAQILETDRRIRTSARSTEVGRRLMEIPGVGPLLASALVASIADPKAFKTGRNLAAWIGLVPKQNSSGGKERLGGLGPFGRGGQQHAGQDLEIERLGAGADHQLAELADAADLERLGAVPDPPGRGPASRSSSTSPRRIGGRRRLTSRSPRACSTAACCRAGRRMSWGSAWRGRT